ncbi:hypothetical protein K2012_004311 [Salmonella enterica]|nr:hypothetical protein [Salmonella enterica]
MLAVMETMLGSLESDEVTVTRCRQVLTLWITGLDALAAVSCCRGYTPTAADRPISC